MNTIKTKTGEFKLALKRSPFDSRDYKLTFNPAAPRKELPDEVNYIPNMRKVRNQGSQGTCAAMTGAAIKEYQELIDCNFDKYMSPQFLYNKRENQSSEGMYPRDLFKILQKSGCCSEESYPYGSTGAIPSYAKTEANEFKILRYGSIFETAVLRSTIHDGDLCLFAVPVYNSGTRMWKYQTGDTLLGGHAMCCVGYNAEGFILRNSWGEGWGDSGYCIFPYEDWGLQWECWTCADVKCSPFVVPKEKPWYKKMLTAWWFWLPISLLVVGGVVAGIVFGGL